MTVFSCQVMSMTECSRLQAVNALRKHVGIVLAIRALTPQQVEDGKSATEYHTHLKPSTLQTCVGGSVAANIN